MSTCLARVISSFSFLVKTYSFFMIVSRIVISVLIYVVRLFTFAFNLFMKPTSVYFVPKNESLACSSCSLLPFVSAIIAYFRSLIFFFYFITLCFKYTFSLTRLLFIVCYASPTSYACTSFVSKWAYETLFSSSCVGSFSTRSSSSVAHCLISIIPRTPFKIIGPTYLLDANGKKSLKSAPLLAKKERADFGRGRERTL